MSTATANKENFVKGEFLPIPEGDYLLRMTRYEESENRKGNGINGKATFQVVNGDYKNRLIFENFVVQHSDSPMAEKIGLERLSKFLESVGVNGGLDGLGQDRTQIEDYLEMPFIGSLGIKEAQEYTKADGTTATSKASNKIKAFKAR